MTDVRCPKCGNEIDPDVCWCGDYIKGHGHYDGHSPVPMGCDCGRIRIEDVPELKPNSATDPKVSRQPTE
jgi:hypothetical protein